MIGPNFLTDFRYHAKDDVTVVCSRAKQLKFFFTNTKIQKYEPFRQKSPIETKYQKNNLVTKRAHFHPQLSNKLRFLLDYLMIEFGNFSQHFSRVFPYGLPTIHKDNVPLRLISDSLVRQHINFLNI